MASEGAYDLIVVGSGFAGSFFLHKYLEHAPETARVLVLEKGPKHDHQWHRENIGRLGRIVRENIVNRTPEKEWKFNVAFGGSSNCWWACTPRQLPADFETQSRFGHGTNWPLRYDDLEEYYCQTEELMAISGPPDIAALFPRSRPFPQPPHLMTDPDKLFKKAFPGEFFVMPNGRARETTANGRARCCASGVCSACPIDSKYSILNEMQALYADSRIELLADAPVESIETANNVATGVRYRHDGATHEARGEFIALGANAMFNPFLLLQSGIDHPGTGEGLCEQVGVSVEVYLDGVDNFQGSTSLTGHGYMLHGDASRTDRAPALMETSNLPKLRDTRGKWRQYLLLKFIIEDHRRPDNRVLANPDGSGKPIVEYRGHSAYANRAVKGLQPGVERCLSALPIESYRISDDLNPTQAHIMCTAVMGNDPQTSVIDRNLIHHKVRNLAVLGSSAFPTAPPANPTLTLAALSLWSADRVFGPARV